MSNVPKIIHLMFFPWGKDQKLLADQKAFDHGPYERMKVYAPDFEVMLWDYYATEKLCMKHYPEIWAMAINFPRPMMTVNTLRWLMVYHHGGISWQYDMNPLRPMAAYLPSPDKECRVFTEFELTPEQCRIKSDEEPIRAGIPEEPVRIPSQVFSAVPRHRYMKAVVDYIRSQAQKYTFKRDYDCQFITGNAAASTAYDLYGKNDPTVERVGVTETRTMIKIIYQGTWRTENKTTVEGLRLKVEGEEKKSSGPALRSSVGGAKHGFLVLGTWLKTKIKEVPGYYWVRPHLHEEAFRGLRLKVAGSRLKVEEEEIQHPTFNSEPRTLNPDNPSRGICDVDPTVLDAVASLIRERGVRSVLNYPEAHLVGLREKLDEGVKYIGGDMVRGSGARWMNVMFSRVPKVEVVIMRNFLDHIGTEEALTVIRRLREAGVRWLISTDYPCLNTNWLNFAGEWRPVSLAIKPYGLVKDAWSVRDEDVGRRTDRELGLFRLKTVD